VVGLIFDGYSSEIEDQRDAYFYSSIFFVLISFVVLIIAICLEVKDHRSGKILDKVYLRVHENNLNIENMSDSESNNYLKDSKPKPSNFQIKRSF